MHILTYWWIAVALDWSSTIEAHDWRVEENPFMREIWKNYGDIGFTIITLTFGILLSIAIKIGFKYGHKEVIVVAAIPMITFKILIALTNLAVIPIWVTGWFKL
jgi:hypothetical protein